MSNLNIDVIGEILDFLGIQPSASKISSQFYISNVTRLQKFRKDYPFADLKDPRIKKYDKLDIARYYLNRAALRGEWDIFMFLTDYYIKFDMLSESLYIAHVFKRYDLANEIIDKYGYPKYIGPIFEYYKYKRGEISLSDFVHHSMLISDFRPFEWIGYVPLEATEIVTQHIFASTGIEDKYDWIDVLDECWNSSGYTQEEACDRIAVVLGKEHVHNLSVLSDPVRQILPLLGKGNLEPYAQLLSKVDLPNEELSGEMGVVWIRSDEYLPIITYDLIDLTKKAIQDESIVNMNVPLYIEYLYHPDTLQGIDGEFIGQDISICYELVCRLAKVINQKQNPEVIFDQEYI